MWSAETPAGHKLAVKALKPAWKRRAGAAALLRREHALLDQVRHPNIVAARGLIEHDEGLVLAMEYLGGGDLVALAGSHPRHWIDAVRGVGEALRHLARRGYAHCDVKARNVLFGDDDRARLIDFSSAAPLGTVPTRGGRTAAYARSEAAHEVTQAEDVHAFAVLLYEMMSARLPFGPDGSTRGGVRPPLAGVGWGDEPAVQALGQEILRALEPPRAPSAPRGSLTALLTVIESVIAAYPQHRGAFGGTRSPRATA